MPTESGERLRPPIENANPSRAFDPMRHEIKTSHAKRMNKVAEELNIDLPRQALEPSSRPKDARDKAWDTFLKGLCDKGSIASNDEASPDHVQLQTLKVRYDLLHAGKDPHLFGHEIPSERLEMKILQAKERDYRDGEQYTNIVKDVVREWKKYEKEVFNVQESLRKYGGAYADSTDARAYLGSDAGKEWLFSSDGTAFRNQHAETFEKTDVWKRYLESDEGKHWQIQRYLDKRSDRFNTNKDTIKADEEALKYLESDKGQKWLQSREGQEYLCKDGVNFFNTHEGYAYLRKVAKPIWFQSDNGEKFLRQHSLAFANTKAGQNFFKHTIGQTWLQSSEGRKFLRTKGVEFAGTKAGPQFFGEDAGKTWLQSREGQTFLEKDGLAFIKKEGGKEYLKSEEGQKWQDKILTPRKLLDNDMPLADNPRGLDYLAKDDGKTWLETSDGKKFLRARGIEFAQTEVGHNYFNHDRGKVWLKDFPGQGFLQQNVFEFAQTSGGLEYLKSQDGQAWMRRGSLTREFINEYEFKFMEETAVGRVYFTSKEGRDALASYDGKWFLHHWATRFAKIDIGKDFFRSVEGKTWLEANDGRKFLREQGVEFAQTEVGEEYFGSPDGQTWLRSREGQTFRTMNPAFAVTEAGKTFKASQQWAITRFFIGSTA